MGPRSEDPKLIIRVIIFELVEPIYAHGTSMSRTDGRRTTYDSNTALALRASRGKNVSRTSNGHVLKMIQGFIQDFAFEESVGKQQRVHLPFPSIALTAPSSSSKGVF